MNQIFSITTNSALNYNKQTKNAYYSQPIIMNKETNKAEYNKQTKKINCSVMYDQGVVRGQESKIQAFFENSGGTHMEKR